MVMTCVRLTARAEPVQDTKDTRMPEDRHVGVPVTWDEKELATQELPLARGGLKIKHVSAEYYYKLPIRVIYKSYPIYDPRSGKEPKDYLDWLNKQERVVVWGRDSIPPLQTEEDWI